MRSLFDKRRGLIAGCAALVLFLSACGSDDGNGDDTPAPDSETSAEAADTADPEEPGEDGDGEDPAAATDWPTGTVQMVLPVSPGGALDGVIRPLQPYLDEELGVATEVRYAEGGGTAIGTQVVNNEGAECSPVLFTGLPAMIFAYLTQDVDFTYDDFTALAQLSQEPHGVIVHNDAPWQTIEELVEDARARPGEIRMALSVLTSGGAIAAVAIENATGIEFNKVPFGGGGPARTSVVSGEADVTIAGMYASQPISDDTRVLAVTMEENTIPEVSDDAPTVDEALGTNIGEVGTESFGWFVTSECAEQYPERVERLATAIEAALQNPDYLEDLGELADRVAFLGPEAYDEFTRAQIAQAEDFLQEYPELTEQ